MARRSLEEIFGQQAPAATATAPRRSLDEIFGAQPAPQAPPEAAQEPATLMQGLSPRLVKAREEGAGAGRQALSAGLDALSLPGRSVAAATEKPITPFAYAGAPNAPKSGESGSFTPEGGREFAGSQADTEGQNLAGKIIRDPALIPSLALGGGLLGAAGKVGQVGLKTLTGIGAAEAGTSAAIHQADKVNSGEDFSLGEAALETGLGAAMPGAAKAVGWGVKGANKLLGKLAQGLSGVSEDALRTYGTGFGKGAKDLADASGKQHEIGQELVEALDNLDDFLPEKEVVEQAIQSMPPIQSSKAISTLEGAKTPGRIGSSRAANKKIDEIIADIKSLGGETGEIPAAEYRALRQDLDKEIGDGFGKESSAYLTALKKARYQMADDLVEAAPAEYAPAMQSMAQKLRTADKLKSFLGKSAQSRETRAESFVSTLFSKNKTERREAVKQMGEIFGKDFLEQSRLAALASELGEEGKAGLLPQQFTGRSGLGPGLAFLGGQFLDAATVAPTLGLSSPKVASTMLAGTGLADRAINDAGTQAGLSLSGRSLLRPAFRNNRDPKDQQ